MKALLKPAAGLLLLWAVVSAARPLSDPVGGPSLGFSPNADGTVVWPILGIPGAASLGHRVAFGADIAGAVVSPLQDYLVAVRSADGQPVISHLPVDAAEPALIAGARHGGTSIAISPEGAAMALFDRESRMLSVYRGLPGTPELVFEVDTTPVDGRLASFAVSDDAAVVLMGFYAGGGDSLWAVGAAGAQFACWTHASSMTFFPSRHDAVVVDNNAAETFLLPADNDSAAHTSLLARGDGVDGMNGAAASADGRYVVVAGAVSGTVGIFDLQSAQRTVVRCNCKPSGVYRMTGTAVFRLNEPADGLTTILDLSTGKPRVLVIPPEPKADPRKGAAR